MTTSAQKTPKINIELRKPINPAWWLVSYPRSGSSFLRALIANYFAGGDEPLSLNQISKLCAGENHEEVWKALTKKSTTERSMQEEWNARLGYFQTIRDAKGMNLPKKLIKSHTIFASIGGHPSFRFIPDDRIIHVVRHPCDVAISYAHFSNTSLDQSIENLNHSGAFHHGAPTRGYSVFGSWVEHTRSWTRKVGAPVFHVPYHVLTEKTEEVLTALIRFLDHEPDPALIARAVKHSGFKVLQQQEKDDGFSEASKVSQQPYFRDGRSGQWKDQFSQEQARKLMDRDPELMQHFGFAGM